MSRVEGWKSITVGRVAELLNGYAFPSEGFTEGTGVPLIRIRDLGQQHTEVNFLGRFNDRYLVKRDDLLIGMDGDFAVVKWKGRDALLNQRVCKLTARSAEDLNQDFLFYRIIEEINRIQRITAATTVKHLSSKDILSIEIDLAPQWEQAKIAKILSAVDRAIEQTEALIAKQQRIKTGLMQNLLTRGIDDQGNLRSESTHKFKDSVLGRIPVDWEVSLLGDAADVIDPNPSHRYPEASDLGVPIVSTENFEGDNDFDLSGCNKVPNFILEIQSRRCRYGPTDIVFARKGRLGFARPYGYSEKVFSHTVVIIKTRKANEVMTEYLLWTVRDNRFFEQINKRMNSNSGVPTLGVQFLEAIPILIPDISEQQRLTQAMFQYEATMQGEQNSLRKLRALKSALMQDLLTGRKRVTPLVKQDVTH